MRWIMIGVERAQNLCLWRQNAYIAVIDNIVSARRKHHTDLSSNACRFKQYILNNALLFSGYLVFTTFIIYYFEKNMLLLALQVYHSLKCNRSVLLSGNSRGITLDKFTAFWDSSKQSKAWPLYEGILARTGLMDYDDFVS
jgi:hypothetical protein